MSRLTRLLLEGFRLETVLSWKPGFEVLTLVNPLTGERVVYWRRSGRVTKRSVEELARIVRIPASGLVVEFSGTPEVDEEADAELRRMFKRVEYVRGAEPYPVLGERIEAAPGIDVIVLKRTRGTIRVGEGDRVLEELPRLTNREAWILVVRRTPDGRVEVIADEKSRINEYLEAARRGEPVAVFVVWHGRWSTEAFLVKPGG